MKKRHEFGRDCQRLREYHQMTLKQFSKELGCSPSFVCLIETGEKSAPETYVEGIIKLFNLTEPEADRLRRRELRSRSTFRFNGVTNQEARLLAAFQQNRATLDKKRLECAAEILSGHQNTNEEDHAT